MARTWDEIRASAAERLDAGDAQEAFGALREALGYPGELVESTTPFVEALGLFERISAQIAPGALVERARHASANPDDAKALYDFGFALIDAGLNEVAGTVLARADRIQPRDHSIVTELACALERDMRHEDAVRVLRSAPEFVEQSFLVRYLLAFNLVFAGELDEPRQLVTGLHELAKEDNHRFMVGSIEGFLQRATALQGVSPLDRKDLRGWHFVINGSFLLHLSPYGLDEGMAGRYAWVQDDESRCLEGIRRAGAALAALELPVPRVFALPDRESAILAAATGLVLGVPVEPWGDGREEPGLVASYDLDKSIAQILQGSTAEGLDPAVAALREHRPGQVVWSHAASWIRPQPIGPDLVTFLYQFNTSPWGERLRMSTPDAAAEKSGPDEAPIAEIAARIAKAEIEAGALDDLPALEKIARAAHVLDGEHAAGALRTHGQRRRQWEGGPVPSSRFL